MSVWGKLFAGIGLLTVSASAWAIDGEYYTYNGFQETVDAFHRLALIFSSSDYKGLFATAAIAGIFFGVVAVTGKGMMGAKVNLLSWAPPMLIGIIVFNGFILPKGTMHVYDKVKNSFEDVADVPDGLILVASLTNKIERFAINLIDTAAADPRTQYAVAAGGISFDLLNKASSGITDVADSYLTRSLEHYWQDCGLSALNVSGSALTENMLRTENANLEDSFAMMNLAGQTTMYFTDASKGGDIMTCKDAWAAIKPVLDSADTWDAPTRQLCGKAGFNVAKLEGGAAVELVACKKLLMDADDLHGGAGNAANFMRNTYLAQMVLNTMMDGGTDAAQSMQANRSLMNQSIGSFQTVNEWMPRVRGWILAVILGLIPIVAIFLVTPLFFRAAGLVLGLFVWFTTWGVVDAMLHRSAVDAGMAAFFQIQEFNYGLRAIWLTPEASVKALGIFGQAQMAAFGLSSLLVGALFKVSAGSTLGSMASGALGKAQSEGAHAAASVGTMEGQAGMVSGGTHAMGTMANAMAYGVNRLATSGAVEQSSRTANNLAIAARGGIRGQTPIGAGAAVGSMGGGATSGQVAAYQNILETQKKPFTDANLTEVAENFSKVDKARQLNDTKAYRDSLATLYKDPAIKTNDRDFQDAAARYSANKAWTEIVNAQGQNEKREILAAAHQKTWGEAPTDSQMTRALATMQFGHEFAEIGAFGATPDAWLAVKQFAVEKNFDLSYGEMKNYQKAGIDPSEIFSGVGAMTALRDRGMTAALKEMGPRSFIAAAKMDAARHAGSGNAWDEFVQQRFGGDEKTAANELAKGVIAPAFGRYAALKMMANKLTDGNMLDAQISQDMTSARVTVSQDVARKFGHEQKFTPAQMDVINHSPNGVEMNFSMQENGQVSNVSVYSGSRVERSATSSSDTSNRVATGFHAEGAVQAMLLGNRPEDVEALRSTVAKMDNNPDVKQEFFKGVTAMFNTIDSNSATRSSVVTGGLAVHGGMDTSKSLIGKGVERVFGISGGASGKGDFSDVWSDTTNWDANRILTEKAYPELQKHARKAADDAERSGGVTGTAEKEAFYTRVLANDLRTFAATVMQDNIHSGTDQINDAPPVPVVGELFASRAETVGKHATDLTIKGK